MTQTARLSASDWTTAIFFASSVAINGDTIVVGDPLGIVKGNSSGAAYVFVKPATGWTDMTQTAKLWPSDGVAEDRFGREVAISGDAIVVGAPYDDDKGTDSGSAYVFVKPVTGWADMTQTAKLAASDEAAWDNFGLSVAISGETIVVGDPFDDDKSLNAGSAYVFVKPATGWADMTQTAKLTASDGAARDWFGWCVAISGDTIVVGDLHGDDTMGTDFGSAYVYAKPATGWTDMTQTARLTAIDGAAGDAFGDAVAINGDTIVIGAPSDDDKGSFSGSAYVFGLKTFSWPLFLPAMNRNSDRPN
jgi:hypothetical protein